MDTSYTVFFSVGAYVKLREKCPNREFFLARIFLFLDWIQKNTDQKQFCSWTLFMQCKTQNSLAMLFKKHFFCSNVKNENEHFELSRLAVFKKSNGTCTSYLIIFDIEMYVTLFVSLFYCLSRFKEMPHFAMEVQWLVEAAV